MSTTTALMMFLHQATAHLGFTADHTYVVGGAVRNHLLGLPPKDVDVVIDSQTLSIMSDIPATRNAAWLVERLVEQIPAETTVATNQYGVAILTIKGEFVYAGENLQGQTMEIATARKESYEGAGGKGKGYKPTDVSPATIEEDVFRREFTFNTLLWRVSDLAHGPEGVEILDLTGEGLQHLRERVIKTPQDPDKTFGDDPTRQLRILKFLLRYNFTISPEVVEAVGRNAHKLKDMPWSAVAELFLRDILAHPQARHGLKVMAELGILPVLVEMVRENKEFETYLTRTLNNGEHEVLLLLDLADLGPGKRAMSFLPEGGLARFRERVTGMAPADARRYLEALRHPKVDNERLIEEFKLEGRARGALVPKARELMLEIPVLFMAPDALNRALRYWLQEVK